MYKTLILLSCLIPGWALAQNSPPIVDAGEDQTILLGTHAQLNGTATDVDGQTIAEWLWAVHSAPEGGTPEIFYSYMHDPMFLADVDGDYVLSLVAFDGMDWSEPDFVTIHVIDPATLPPTANAGPDQRSSVDGVALLRGSAADILYRPIADWLWAVESAPAGSAHSISHPSMPTTRFSADTTGEYVLSLIASNGVGWSEPDLVSIIMEETSNHPPVVDAGEDQTTLLGYHAQLNGTATDVDDQSVAAWLWMVDSAPEGSTPEFFFSYMSDPMFLADVDGDYVLSVIASDGLDWCKPDYVTIHIHELLSPVAVLNVDVTEGPAPLTVQFDGAGSYDPDGDDLSYTWDFDDGSPTEGGVLVIHAYETAGIYTVTLSVEDDWGGIGTDTAVVTILSPAEFTEELIEAIESWGLPASTERLFIQPLSSIADLLAKARERAAIGRLTGFIHLCESQRGKKLTEEQADVLIEGAERLLSAIE